MQRLLCALLVSLLLPALAYSQDDPPIEEEGDDAPVDYSALIQTEKNKAFCSSRILGQVPIKLLSVGYDYQMAHTLGVPSMTDAEANQESDIESAQGLRLALNYPVISKNNFLLSLGVNYAESQYSFSEATDGESDFLSRAMDTNGLRTAGFTATAFKPLNSKRYLIAQFGANLNGDYTFSDPQSLTYTRYTGALIYGIKANDRKIWGLGLSRTYLGGSLNYVPVYYLLYSAKNKKWGMEMLLPARLLYRRTLNAKNLLLVGWETEGNTFRISNDDNIYDLPYNDIELRRSELRLRASWEHALTRQVWLSVQAGYRYNWSFDVDRGDFFRPFGDDTPFLVETELSNPAYFNVSLSWVSP